MTDNLESSSPAQEKADSEGASYIFGALLLASLGIHLLRMFLTSILIYLSTRLLIISEELRPSLWACVLVGILVELWYDSVRRLRRIPERLREHCESLTEEDFDSQDDLQAWLEELWSELS